MIKVKYILTIALLSVNIVICASQRGKVESLSQLQQNFLDLRFGMFIHYNIPTYCGDDWPDPNQSIDVFNPKKLDCNQWADAAVSAGMSYGCLTTKHHSGFCIWPTKTTDYNVSNTPYKKDIVRQFVDAFRKKGLKIFLYYSILDTHHNIRKGWINKKENTNFIKKQLTELLTNYGEITCLVIDGWDATWSRIGYDEISFEEIYRLVKKLQPNCLISEHNAAKYPPEQLFYTDIKHYEQNAGQKISKEINDLPAQAGIPINKNWFWKESFPVTPVKSAEYIVKENIIPLNEAHCNFILNVAPNPDGLIDNNVIVELKKIGNLWHNPGKAAILPVYHKPIIAKNLAKGKRMNSSWSRDIFISDFANDDNFWGQSWIPSPLNKKQDFLEVIFDEPTTINSVGFVELCGWYSGYKGYDPNVKFNTKLKSYHIELWNGKQWNVLPLVQQTDRIRIHDFKAQKVLKVKLVIDKYDGDFGISEIMVYNKK